MGIFDGLGKKVGEAAQAAAKKSNELMEVTKLNLNVKNEEDKIQKLYNEIGKKMYERFCSGEGINEAFKAECEQVKVHNSNIDELKQKILKVKNVRICSSCNAEVPENSGFCAKCGAKQEVEQPTQEKPEDSFIVCPACNKQLEKGSVFCMDCGSKIG